MTQNNTAYHLKDIQHYYGNTKVLDIADLKIQKGSITGLIGPNGSGKTTLLKLLAFVQKPTTGDIFYKGRIEFPFSPFIRSKVTLLTQKPYLLKRTIFENIVYGLKIRKDKKNLKERVNQALLTVGLDYEKFAQRKWHELSGGEAQRVSMAARLILKPEVLLLDEPIASVDTKSAALIRKASLKARDDWGATLVIASHDLQWLYSISDKQLSIFKGKVFSTGLENIITGPFTESGIKSGIKIVIKKLGNGQSIILKAPPAPTTCTAVIKQTNIAIALEKQPHKDYLNQLSGHITSMLLEGKKGYIMASISINNFNLILSLTPDQISNINLYPGKKIILSFHSNDIEWL